MSDAISKASDFKVYEDEINLGIHEALALNSNIFNEASGGAINLVTQAHPGNYMKRGLFTQIDSLVSRQDITSTAAVDSLKLEQDEIVAVKLHRKIGPVQVTPKAYKMAGLSMPEGAMILGRQLGDAMLKSMADAAIISAKGAVLNISGLQNDITSEETKTATIKQLHRTKMKWGDQAGKLAAFICHSAPYTDLWEDGLNYSLESVAGMQLTAGGFPPALGARLIVSDNTNLVNATPTPDQYYTLGLAAGAIEVMQAANLEWAIERHTGYEQILYEVQGEFEITVMLQGFAWDISNGGANPTDASLATAGYWDQVYTDENALPIVCLISQ